MLFNLSYFALTCHFALNFNMNLSLNSRYNLNLLFYLYSYFNDSFFNDS